MKIKTITCHDVYNSGASLQAYALVTYLNSLGHDAEIIDYKPDYLSRHYSLSYVTNKKFNRFLIREAYLLAKLPSRLIARYGKRKTNYDIFREKYLPVTRTQYHSNDDLKNNTPKADLYIAGSDQIWNTLFENGKDPAFYLDFVPKGGKKVSYAASFATESIVEEWKAVLKKRLSSFHAIAVRELSGLTILESLGINNGTVVLDPVFLLEKKEWELLSIYNTGCEPYLLVYDFDGSNLIKKLAEKVAKEKGLKIYTLQQLGYGDKVFCDAGPIEFLSLVKNADMVLSNSFHATAFSLIFERNFFVFIRKEHINTRMKDLVEMFGLGARMVSDYDFEILSEDIDYISVQIKMKKIIDKSKQYLNDVIEGG